MSKRRDGCPFKITVSAPEDRDAGNTLNGILEHRWRTDPAFRRECESAVDAEITEDLDRKVKGYGYLRLDGENDA